LSGVGGPAKEPRSIFCSRCRAAAALYWSGSFAMVYIPPVDDDSCLQIGKIITRWGFLDKQFNDLIQRMTTISGTALKPAWRKQLKLEQRYELFNKETKLCFGTFPAIEAELLDIRNKMEVCQLDRDMFAHGEIGLLWPMGALHIRYRRRQQKIERVYNLADLQLLVGNLTELLDRLSRLTDESALDQSAWSPQELSALRDFLSHSR
jgi:hypothetical protein